MIQELLDSLGERPEHPVFLGKGAITRGEFSHLVWSFAGGLRQRRVRNFAIVARPGPTTLALALAAVGVGARVDLIDPRGGTELVRARLDAARPDFVAADPLLRFALTGPKWLRTRLHLPDKSIWPEIVAMSDISGPQERGLRVAANQPAVTVFTSGTTAEPRGVVHTIGSLSAGMGMVASLLDTGAGGAQRPIVASTFFVMLPALAVGIPVVLPDSKPKLLARQLTELRPSHTYLTPPQWRGVLAHSPKLSGRVYAGSAPVTNSLLRRLKAAGAEQAWGVYAMTEVFPIAAVEEADKLADDPRGDHVGKLFDGVEARVAPDGELHLSGASMAPLDVAGGKREEAATGDIAVLEGRDLWLQGRAKDMILRGAENIYPGLYEPRLALDGVDVALLLGVPAEDGDEKLVLLVQAHGDETRLRKSLARAAAEMALPLDEIVFGEVPTSGRSQKPDRGLARRQVMEARP